MVKVVISPKTIPSEKIDISMPNYGELWDCEGRVSFVASNHVRTDESVWVMDWNTGERGDARTHALTIRTDRYSVKETDLLDRFSKWSREGNSDAMWFLAWYFEGVNHPKSIWYYIAALRANVSQHSWAYSRIIGDARSAYTCEDVPTPNLDFLDEIPEMHEPKIHCHLWREAVANAEMAVHLPDFSLRS